MSLSDLATISGTISGVAVVVTLVLLLLQMRQTNRNQKAVLQQGRSTRLIETILTGADHHVSEALARAVSGDLSMTDAQIRSVSELVTAFYWNFEDSFLQHQAGLLAKESWETDVATLRFVCGLPMYRVGWKMSRGRAGGAYRAYVDSVIGETKPRKPTDASALWKKLMTDEIALAV